MAGFLTHLSETQPMKYWCAPGVLLLAISLASAGGSTLQDGRQRWLHGEYEEARAIYEALAKDAKQQVPASLGLSLTLESKGEYDKALEVVDAALANHKADADLYARRAQLLYLRGRWDDAAQAAEKALQLKPEHFLARWVRG